MKWLNDIHSQLNRTAVREIQSPRAAHEIARAIRLAREAGLKISSAGGRHAMGGQQFGAGNLHLDLSGLSRVLSFDRERGILEVEAGIQWPRIVEGLLKAQAEWGIRQKQTGADRLSIGGALSANVHGRGLRMKPIIDDVESFTLIGADGELRQCSRTENSDLFRLAIGGYGQFGIIYSVRLRLAKRQCLRRVVEITTTDELAAKFEDRIRNGFLFGDFQFAIDSASGDFLRRGVFACYEPAEGAPDSSSQRQLTPNDWQRLLHLAHTDPSGGFEQYARFYQSTHGQRYWSDMHQLGYYCDDYHRQIDEALCCPDAGSEMISELYVPRESLAAFMDAARDMLRREKAKVVYGTVRVIEADRETFLPWARGNFACIVFNLHCDHNAPALEKSAAAFRGLIDIALYFGGSFYLTYHRYAAKAQLLEAYPMLPAFLAEARQVDPGSLFESDWSRHTRRLFNAE